MEISLIRKKDYEYIYVHPSFKKRLKTDASIKGISVIKYTKELSGSKSLEEEFSNAEQRGKKSGFYFKL